MNALDKTATDYLDEEIYKLKFLQKEGYLSVSGETKLNEFETIKKIIEKYERDRNKNGTIQSE